MIAQYQNISFNKVSESLYRYIPSYFHVNIAHELRIVYVYI